jgi:putative membrane protein
MKRVSLLFIVSAALATTPAWAQPVGDGDWMWHSGWGWGGMMVGGGLLMVAFWVGVIVVIVLLVRGLAGSGTARGGDPSRPTALEILKERFARGEIDKAEYEDRRKTLGG